MNYVEITGEPLEGTYRESAKALLQEDGLTYETPAEYTYCLVDEYGVMIATVSLDANVIKYVAVSKHHQGEGLTATLMTHIVGYAMAHGQRHLFLYTKPESVNFFKPFGFYEVQKASKVVLLENKRNGLASFLQDIQHETAEYLREHQEDEKQIHTIGAIVANCNPFTCGHRYLIETASKQCDLLHVFVVSSDKSTFPKKVRFSLVKKGCADVPHTVVHSTGDYLVSPATFPTYFMKDVSTFHKLAFSHELDINIFLQYFVKNLHINIRFVGTEPLDKTTNAYNQSMAKMLPLNGVQFVEIPRKEQKSRPISASRVRKLMEEGRGEETKDLVPPTTYAYLISEEAKALFE
jgi:[citrate (pro-3S)-lyase] ligase